MIGTLADRFVSPALAADPDRGFRARVVAGLGLALLVSGLPAAVAVIATRGADDPRVWLAMTPSLGQLVVLRMLRRSADHRPAAALQLLLLLLGQIAFILVDGGLHSPAVPWALALPVLAAMTIGPRAGWIAAGLAATEIIVAFAADHAGIPLGEAPSADQIGLLRGTSLVLLVGVLALAAVLFESARRNALNASRDALARLRSSHADLLQAHELTLEATRARRDLLARVSHEVRTPVQGVLGTTQLLLDRQTTDAGRELATGARDSARGLLNLLEDLLDVGRLEAGELRLADTRFDPRVPLEDAAGLVAGEAQAKGLTLLCYVGGDVPSRVSGDPDRLRQVSLNLLANAVRYTDAGDVVLRAGLTDDGGTPTLRVEVTDSGVGIDLEKTPRSTLLRAFEQAEPFSTRSHGGAGLGLAIAAQIVGLMGGTLDVESELGTGSTFWFTMPLRGETGATQGELFRGLRAIVIGQHIRSRGMIATLLRDWGMTARALPPLPDVRAQLCAGSLDADVLLLDVQPGDEPAWRAEALGAESELALMPLIAITPASLLGDSPREPGAVVLAPPRQARLRDALDRLARAAISDPVKLEAALVTGESRLANIPRGEGRVLIVEDDPVNALIGRRFLQRIGYTVEVAADGNAGLAAAQSSSFDAILMDCQLPGLSGYEVTEQLRAGDGPNRDAPILAVTAHAVDNERERCLEAGMNACLTKPYEPEDLANQLHQLLGRGS